MALVGPNGAGKSTLIKLLCRFYDPDAGQIKLNGIDLRDLPLEELRVLITVLFQEPVHYNDTVSENIALGDLATAPGVTFRQLKQTASKDMHFYRYTLRPSGCVPARLSLESDARFSASGAKHSFHAAIPSPVLCCQAYAANQVILSHSRGHLEGSPAS